MLPRRRQRPIRDEHGPRERGQIEELRGARRELGAARDDGRIGLAEPEGGERGGGIGRGLELREEVLADLAPEQDVHDEVGFPPADRGDEHALALELGDSRGAAADEDPAVVALATAYRGREDRIGPTCGGEVRGIDDRERDLAFFHRGREVPGARVDLAGAGRADRLAELIAELGGELDARRGRWKRGGRREQTDGERLGLRRHAERTHEREGELHGAPP